LQNHKPTLQKSRKKERKKGIDLWDVNSRNPYEGDELVFIISKYASIFSGE
jgi:hypothetical protein